MRIAALMYVLTGVVLAAGPAAVRAETKLPAGVQPLSAAATTGLYSNKTIDYGTFAEYFAPDGRLTGYTKNHKSSGTGTWRVSDNEICTQSDWRYQGQKKGVVFHSCSAWYSDGRTYWAKITKGAHRGEVYKGNASAVSDGDRVSEIACGLDHSNCR